jgi:hypothetical protein
MISPEVGLALFCVAGTFCIVSPGIMAYLSVHDRNWALAIANAFSCVLWLGILALEVLA